MENNRDRGDNFYDDSQYTLAFKVPSGVSIEANIQEMWAMKNRTG